ncbi:hypothetical protein CAPTEDRAFT_69117, partial [Capitella teleta]
WKEKRSEWAFRKVRQTWLLQNMFDLEQIDEDNYEVLLEYLEGSRGHARTSLIEKAEEMLKGKKDGD